MLFSMLANETDRSPFKILHFSVVIWCGLYGLSNEN